MLKLKNNRQKYTVINKIMFLIDYYILFLLYNERKFKRYKRYMKKKWGKNYHTSYIV